MSYSSLSQPREEPSGWPAPPAPAPASPSPSFLSPLSSFLSAAASEALALLSLLFGLASLLLAPAEAALLLPGCYWAAEALRAACICWSSSSIPFSNRKFAAISSFLSQARYASAALLFGKPRETRRSIASISSCVTEMEPGGGLGAPPLGWPPIPAI